MSIVFSSQCDFVSLPTIPLLQDINLLLLLCLVPGVLCNAHYIRYPFIHTLIFLLPRCGLIT